jgi:hypothetical protein
MKVLKKYLIHPIYPLKSRKNRKKFTNSVYSKWLRLKIKKIKWITIMQMNKFGLRKTQNCSSQSNNKIDSDILFFLNLLFLMLFKLHSSKI